MKRDLDLIREILLHIEEGWGYDGLREFYYSDPEELGITGRTAEEFVYHFRLLVEEGYVDGATTIVNVTLRRLTSKGHDFLDHIRDPRVWTQVKLRLGSVEGVALSIIEELAKSEIRKQLGLP